MRAKFLAAPPDDAKAIASFYEGHREGLGAEFREDLKGTVKRIEAFPEAWSVVEDDIRRCRMVRFPSCGIFYRQLGKEILILAVADLRRRPDHWRNRI